MTATNVHICGMLYTIPDAAYERVFDSSGKPLGQWQPNMLDEEYPPDPEEFWLEAKDGEPDLQETLTVEEVLRE